MLSTEEVLKRIFVHIQSGNLENEAQIKKATIDPIIRSLGWDDTNPSECIVEHKVKNLIKNSGDQVIDYVLCGLEGVPFVLIKVQKFDANFREENENLLSYAKNQHIPIIVIVTGYVWRFYLSATEDVADNCQFHSMELRFQDKVVEHANFLSAFLHKEKVSLGETLVKAQNLLFATQKERRVRKMIPVVWNRILEGSDELFSSHIRDLIVEAVEEYFGDRPKLSDVDGFLKNRALEIVNENDHLPNITTSSHISSFEHDSGSNKIKIVGFVIDGRRFETRSGNHALSELLKEFHRQDPNFMARFESKTSGKKRSLVHKTKEGLYRSSPHLRKYARDLGNGWWMGTNISTLEIQQFLHIAAEEMGIEIGSRLKIIEQ